MGAPEGTPEPSPTTGSETVGRRPWYYCDAGSWLKYTLVVTPYEFSIEM